MPPPVTFCVLTYGDHLSLAKRAIESIARNCPRAEYQLVVGANAVSEASKLYLEQMLESRQIDRLHASPTNLNKCPMMRRMFQGIETEFIWWLDDDSYITQPWTFSAWLRIAMQAPPETVMWGQQCVFNEYGLGLSDPVQNFVKSATWYRGKLPPAPIPLDVDLTKIETWSSTCQYWTFLLGGCWLMRSNALRALDWPDPRLFQRIEDVFLAEAIRQQGWNFRNVDQLGLVISEAPSRGDQEDQATLEKRMKAKATG